MKESVVLDFAIPIWKVFFNSGWPHRIPFEFQYEGKNYRNGVTILHFGWYVPHMIDQIRNCLHKYINPILCAPDEESKRALENANLNCFAIVLAGHNAFINEDYYYIMPEIPRNTKFICNSAFEPYKRRHLQNKLNDIIHIGYFHTDSDANIPRNGYCPNFNTKRTKSDWKPVSPNEVRRYYNQCKVGVILSEFEGSCYSSGEYLLCGLPVVSTRCTGGRQHWYNSKNSVICEPTQDAVLAAGNLALEKINSGEFNPYDIRHAHIEEMNRQRHNLVEAVFDLFTKVTLDHPDKEKLFDRLKHYHSNTNSFANQDDYAKTQLSDEHIALKVLGII
jgi:hypothetical protein